MNPSIALMPPSSTLLRTSEIPSDGKWYCVKSESKNLTNAEIQSYIRNDKGLGEFRIDKEYSSRYGIHTTYFKCAISSECNCTFKIGRTEVSNGTVREPTDTVRLCASLLRSEKFIKSDFIHVI